MGTRGPFTSSESIRPRQPRSSWRSLRVQLLLAVNAVAFLGIAAWLTLDYRWEVADQLRAARVSLANEARALAPLLARLHHIEPTEVQTLVNDVCMSMQTEDSPEHHIVVLLGSERYESAPHPGMSSGNAAGAHPVGVNGSTAGEGALVSGKYQTQEASVEVSKSSAVVMREVRRRAIARLIAICSGAVAVALIANLLIIELVNRPLKRLVAAVRRIAGGDLGSTPGHFRTLEFNFLAEEIGHMSMTLAENERGHRSQITRARQLQHHLSPSPERLPGLEFAAAYMPADNVAGDYYDVLPLAGSPDGRTFLVCLADVCGHGVPAAMGASMLKALLLDACEKTSDPTAVLRHINRQFVQVSLPGDFASMFVGVVRPGQAELTYACAGHEDSYLVGANGRVVPLASTGSLIGIDSQWTWEARRVSVQPGDRLLLVSDGLTEALDARGMQFGRDRLATLLQTAPADTAALLRTVLDVLSAHTRETPLRDDVTVVAVGLDSADASVRSANGEPRSGI